MKGFQMTTDESRHGYQIQSDGKTVWVNSPWDGSCIGRFSSKGIDIHHTVEKQIEMGVQCINCTHEKPTFHGWLDFVAELSARYDIEDHILQKHRPNWVEGGPPNGPIQ